MNDATLQTTALPASAVAVPKPTGQAWLIAACSIGNALEMYDFTVYSFLTLMIGKLFFPSDSTYGSLLLAVAMLSIGFMMRPLGGFATGNYADRHGRKAAMMLTIRLMVIGMLYLAATPTYVTAGLLGPLVILAGRLLRGFSLGGEIGASMAMLMESGSTRGHGFRVSWQLGSQGIAALCGMLTAAILYGSLSPEALQSQGWCVPFFPDLLIAPVGLYIRSHLDETHTTEARAPSPLGTLLRDHGGLVIKGVLTIIGGTVGTYLVIYFMPTYMVHELHLSASLSLLAGCVTGLTSFGAPLLSGQLADRLPRREPLVVGATLATVAAPYPAFWLMAYYPSVPLVLALSALLTGTLYLGTTPMLLMMMELLPIKVRASSLSVIYAIGVTVFGGSCQFVVTWLLARTGNPLSPASYMMTYSAITLLTVLSLREARETDWPRIPISSLQPRSPDMTEAPTLTSSQLLPHLLPPVHIDAETLANIRHQIHTQLELSFEVGATSTLVADLLKSWGYGVHTGIGKSGVVGQLKLGNGTRRLGIRADMDALPIVEATGLPYASRNRGKIYARGHDKHIAILLAAAKALAESRDFDGTLNLIFQPNEENLRGARVMIEDSLFERFPCDVVYALHSISGVPAGSFRVLPGPMSLSPDVADVTTKGMGGHGAILHRVRDPIAASAAIITALRTVVAYNVAPDDTMVVSVGFIRGGATHNVIPGSVTIGLNARAARPETRALVEMCTREIVSLTAQAHGVQAQIDYRQLTPLMVNTEAETQLAQRVCTGLIGAANVVTQVPKGLNDSEDFAQMPNEVPGCCLILGNGEGEFGGCMMHNSGYDFNDQVLPLGAAAWMRPAQTYLSAT